MQTEHQTAALKALYARLAAGTVTDLEAAEAEAAIRGPQAARQRPKPIWSARSRPKVRKSPRPRLLAFSGPMPPQLAARFTVCQLAALAVIGERSTMSIAEIAARSGVSCRTVQTALRLAEADGLLRITERRLSASRNDTNVVVVVSREWLAWLRRRSRGGGCKRPHPMNINKLERAVAEPLGSPPSGAPHAPEGRRVPPGRRPRCGGRQGPLP